jgi:hypothetical protein
MQLAQLIFTVDVADRPLRNPTTPLREPLCFVQVVPRGESQLVEFPFFCIHSIAWPRDCAAQKAIAYQNLIIRQNPIRRKK